MISRLNFLFLCTVVFAANSVEAKAKTGETVDSCAGIFLPITAGYGADSIRSIRVEYHKPAAFRHGAIYLYRPETVSVRMPVVFFLHSVGTGNNNSYDKLLRHMASRGLCVLHITYRIKSFPYQGRTYRRMFSSCLAAVKYFGAYIDTTKIGFAGHSFGAAALPYLALRCITERNW